MTINKRLTVLKGGKDINNNRYKFYSAVATKTRLMGVVALKIHWINEKKTHFVQWFLLDAEEQGIYDYVFVKTTLIKETDKYTGQFMGSLGGERVNISRREAFHLIQNFAKHNKLYKKPLPNPKGYGFILNASVKLDLYETVELNKKIFEKIIHPYQAINFFIMRAVAKDTEAIEKLLYHKQDKAIKKYAPIDGAGVLLKNKISVRIKENVYMVESIVEEKEYYHRIKWKVFIAELRDTYKVIDVKVLKHETISPDEAALEIQNPEYIKLFNIKGNDSIILNYFNKTNKDLLKYQFPQGTMFVEFRKNNNHVLRSLYHIGGDIQAIYFLNHYNQLMVCYYHKDDSKGLDEFLYQLKDNLIIEKIDFFERKGSIIYEYAEANKIDFLEYINEMQ